MVQNTRKVTEPDFSSNSVGPNLGKKGQKYPQIGLFQHFFKIESLLLAGNRLKGWTLWLGCMVYHMPEKTLVCPTFVQNDPKALD